MFRLSFPVLVSLLAEPITGLVDTAFVSRLGSGPMASLGAATVVLSGLFWVLNFLSIGTQTEVARAHGARRGETMRRIVATALALAGILGGLLVVATWPFFGAIAGGMGTAGATRDGAIEYLRVRVLGGPAVVGMAVAMGAMRGVQDMRTPLAIAVGTNVLNLGLDPVLIFGAGPVPALGLAGAAWASAASQWAGAVVAVLVLRRRLGGFGRVDVSGMGRLVVVGRDLFLRTGTLMLFLILATRTATRIGDPAGAAHQAIRQVWFLTALALDAYAAAAQSLVGFFAGAERPETARRVASVACTWGLVTGFALTAAMLILEPLAAALLVPPAARAHFAPAWLVAAVAQPLNALSFVTDGVHWATSDYRFLRNVMLLASGSMAALLFVVDVDAGVRSFVLVWILTAAWITVRALFGVLRIWPGIGQAPLGARNRGTGGVLR